MMMRKKMILATIVVGTAIFVNLVLGSVDSGNLVMDQRDYLNEPDDAFYDDYYVVKGQDGRMLLIPKEEMGEPEEEPFVESPTKSEDEPFVEEEESNEIDKFASLEEFRTYLENHTNEYYSYPYSIWDRSIINGGMVETFDVDADVGFSATTSSTSSHSTTNTQVAGVDEGDIVKTDGKYAYILSRDRTSVHIVDVNPPEDAEIVSTIDTRGSIKEMYVKDDALVVIGTRSVYQLDPSPGTHGKNYYTVDYDGEIVEMDIGRFYYLNYIYYQATFIDIFDISVKEEPELKESHLTKGTPLQSRMIGNFLYVLTYQNIYRTFNEYDLPVEASEIYYLNGTNDTNYYNYYLQLTTILSIDITNPSEIVDMRSLLMDYASNVYVSRGNIYISYYKYDYEEGVAKTRIHRILIDNGKIVYKAYGEIEGTILNRFSMDEYRGYFRVAATEGWSTTNTVYVLDMDLEIVGILEDIAPNERLYSARFMGDRAYLVTFRRIDPFHVIDLSDPENPEELGELVIPGWSDYLHPYDENHVIGLGKETNEWGGTQGVKLSLFDVTDVENPEEISKYVIGDRYSGTIAASDPHAFLFSLEKNLLVIPVRLNYTVTGAYVFDITIEDGFVLKGTISHPDVAEERYYPYYWYYNYGTDIKRSFYIDDTLYTLSDSYLKMNDLSDLSEINILEIPITMTSEGNQVMCIYIAPFVR